MSHGHAPRRCLVEGLTAGLALALADWLASGVLRTPPALLAAMLGGGLLAGSLAGAAGALLRRDGLALGLVTAFGVGLEGFSTLSKEIDGRSVRLVGALLVVLVALASLLGCLRYARFLGRARPAWSWCLLASIPAGSLLSWLLSSWEWARIATSVTPLIVLGLERSFPRERSGPLVAALLSVPILALPAPFAEREPLRAPLPPLTTTSGAGRSSIVLLVIDTLRADALDPAGPLARFARGGVEFRQAIASAPWTLPSLGSLLTGLHPSQHGAISAGAPLPREVTTLAEILRANGYGTAAFTGGGFVGAAHRLDQGFETFEPGCDRRFAPFRVHAPLLWRLAKNRYFPLLGLVRWVDEYRGLEGVIAALRRWQRGIGEARPDGPRFLFLHTYQVHDYYLYDPDTDDPVLAREPSSACFAGRLSVHPDELLTASQEELDHFRAIYRARVAAVEQLFPELERAVLEIVGPDAIWIVTADHGEGFDAARARVHHGGRLHDDLLRVPFLMRAPGRLPEGRVVDEQVRTLDLLPTVLELAGIPVPEGIAGESLLPALRGERAFPSAAFGEELAQGYELRSLRRGGWKLITAPGSEELYCVASDPLESSNAPDGPGAELRAELETFPERYPPRAVEHAELDRETLEQLRALGYLR